MRILLTLACAALTSLGCATPTSPPNDPGARPAEAATVPGLYLRRAAADAWDQRHRGGVVWLDADCCSDVDLAVLMAYSLQAANHLDAAVPFFVTATDARHAARVVDRLARNGARHAYLVTP